MNKAILIGRIGKDAELKALKNGENLLKFSLATSEKYKNKNGDKVEKTEWHNINYFVKNTTIGNYLLKGTLVCIEGKITTNEHEGKYYTSITANSVTLLSANNSKTEKTEETNKTENYDDDDFPF